MAAWALLLVVSLALAWVLTVAGMPAALLLGPMLAAVALGLAGARLRMPKLGFLAAQAVVGCLVARAFTPDFVSTITTDGPLMLPVVLVTVAAGAIVGLVLTRLQLLPGTTAAWGSSPGGAAAMVAMAEAYGSDPRIVAFMQYLRVAAVVLAAAFVTRHFTDPGTGPGIPQGHDGEGSVFVTFAVALFGAGLASAARLPAGAMIGPMILGAAIQGTGIAAIAVPGVMLDGAYAAIGWYVGLRFTRETVATTLRALPAMVAATSGLILLCAGWAWGLTYLLSIDFLTAFLATSPGGLDSVAIIAVDAKVDVSFVLSVQTLRLFVVLITGPILAKWIGHGVSNKS